MQWRPKKIKYDILVPNLDRSIFELNEQEAADYFGWYVERIPARVAYVSKVCAKSLHIPVEKMDCSPESLLLLWKWFRRKARTERVIREKSQSDLSPGNLLANTRQLTLETEYILRDVGMYLGETFRKNHPNIYWTYYTKPRRDFFVNHPLLKGFIETSFGPPFEACFEPIHMVGVQAAKILCKKSSDADLFNLYCFWAKRAEQGNSAQGDGSVSFEEK